MRTRTLRCCRELLILALACAIQSAYSEPVTKILNNGDAKNRIDIVVMGDGFTTAELSAFATAVQTLFNGFFDEEPFKEYKSYFNVHRIDVVSTDSGIDHPENNVFKETALGGHFNCTGIQRLICVDASKVNVVLDNSVAADERDIILVIVNDPQSAGTAQSGIGIVTTHADYIDITLHELGHSFGLLGDEFETNPPPCINNIEPFQVNVTKETDRNLIKWNTEGGPPTGWIDSNTLVPTTSTTDGVPGLYEGAKFCSSGLYRPTHESKMRVSSKPFEQINEEQLIKRIYNFVSPIETIDPVNLDVILEQGASTTFRITTMSPPTQSLSIAWSLNGAAQGAGLEFTLNTTGLTPGIYNVKVVVKDQNPKVRNDPDGEIPETLEWRVAVQDNDGVSEAPLADQDQPNVSTTGAGTAIGLTTNNSPQKVAQTVTAGRAGFLAEIRLLVACTSGDLDVEIQRVTAGNPDGTVLASETVPGSAIPFPRIFRRVIFSNPAFFPVGGQFAIVLKSAGSCGIDRGLAKTESQTHAEADYYTSGTAFFANAAIPEWSSLNNSTAGKDYPFQTLVPLDNCPFVANPTQADFDNDGAGDACDDSDSDGVVDADDAFPGDPNETVDTDNDGTGNNADTDDDNDQVLDTQDAFPLDANESVDTDSDGTGNNADTDDDNDGVLDAQDAFPLDANESVDTDSDGTGNNADTDDDNDGVLDTQDAFPLDANESVDTDNDGTGNNADTDDDNDGVLDTQDAFPLNANESVDTDSDGTGNNADTDDDNDGVLDTTDAFPLDPAESVDTDSDGVGNNADTDDDNDGMPDSFETANNFDPLNAADGSQDADGDGFTNEREFRAGTDPHDANSIPKGSLFWLSLILDE